MDLDGEGNDCEHLDHGEQPMAQVVGVEPRGIERRTDPRPPHRDEQDGVAEDPRKREVVAEHVSEFGDRDHEHQVEEEFEPGGAPLVVAFACLAADP